MIVKEKQNLKPITHTTRHYKLYKDGKHLVTAGIASLSVIGVMAVSSEITVHADTNNDANGAQQTATGGNAVTATTSGTSGQASTITQPVNVDHSQLNNAVDQARQAGLTVNQKPTTTQTVSQDQVDVAKQNIQNDETKQAQQIQTITRQHQTEVSNVNNFNGSKGDTSQLDAKVQEAQSVPGLTVVHDQDQTTVKKASDTQGIQEAVNNATQSNNDQAQSIQNAIDTQKQYNKENDEWKAAHNISGDVALTSQLNQQLITGTEDNAKMTISNLQGGQIIGEETQASFGSGNVFPDTYIKLTGDHMSFDVTWDNLQHTTYKGKAITSLKEHFEVYKNVTRNKNATNNFDDNNGEPNLKGYSIHISHDPTKGFNQFGLTATFVGQYYYADGSPVNFEKGNAYLSVGSLDNYQNGLKQYSREEAIVNSGGVQLGLLALL